MADADNIAIITDFIAAWSRLDADELASYFTEDGCYHNIPVGPVCGIGGLFSGEREGANTSRPSSPVYK